MGVLVYVAAWVAVLVSCTAAPPSCVGDRASLPGVQCWLTGLCPCFEVDTDLNNTVFLRSPLMLI